MDDDLDDRPIHRALVVLAGRSTFELLKVLDGGMLSGKHVFNILLIYVAAVVDKHVAEGTLRRGENGRGFEGASYEVEKTWDLASFCFTLANVEEPDLPPNFWEYVKTAVAYLLEAARHPLTWGELTERERELLEPASFKMLQEQEYLDCTCPYIPLDDNLVEPTFNFIVWWARNGGRLPEWFVNRGCVS